MGIDYTKKPNPAAGAEGSPSKVTLTKSTPTLSLTKQGSSGGQMRVNLNWTARPAGAAAPAGGGGFLSKLKSAAVGAGGGAIDLDLGALYEFTDGSKGVVQA